LEKLELHVPGAKVKDASDQLPLLHVIAALEQVQPRNFSAFTVVPLAKVLAPSIQGQAATEQVG